jgi:general secretion pathway protein N
MSQRSTHWATGIWLLLCTGLGGMVALQLTSSLPLAPEVTAALPAAPLPELPTEPAAFDPPPSSAFGEIAERPLFSESRRPFVPETEAEEPAAPDEQVSIELVGTLLTEDGRAALLQPAGQVGRWLRTGEKIAGWQIETIERDRITLRLDDETKTLQLRADLVPPPQAVDRAERRRTQRPALPGEPGQDQADRDQAERSPDEPSDQPDD